MQDKLKAIASYMNGNSIDEFYIENGKLMRKSFSGREEVFNYWELELLKQGDLTVGNIKDKLNSYH